MKRFEGEYWRNIEHKSSNYENVLIIDNSIFDFLIEIEGGDEVLSSLNELVLGIPIVTDLVMTKSVKKLRDKGIGIPYGELLFQFNENWYRLLEKIELDIKTMHNILNEYKKIISRAINCLNGHINKEDIEILAVASILHENNYSPIVISNDRDILCYGQLIASLFGFCIGILSTYEFLRYMRKEIQLKGYLQKYLNNQYYIEPMSYILRCESLKNLIKTMISKNILCFHPFMVRLKNIRDVLP